MSVQKTNGLRTGVNEMTAENSIKLSNESQTAFNRLMKIGYYKEMLKEKIIDFNEFAILIDMLNNKTENPNLQ